MKGFTLLELMIAVVILTIIAAIAYPSYKQQITKSRRADAHRALLNFASLEERYRTDNGTYTADLTQLGAASPARSTDEYYEITVSAGAGGISDSYVLTATPRGAQAGDTECTSITYSSAGIRSSNAGVGKCW